MQSLIENAINEFKKIDKPIRIISHIDCDGIAAASILVKAFVRENKKFILSNVKQITSDLLKEIALEPYKVIFFTDIGSGYLNLIDKYLKNHKIFILDHHIPENLNNYENITHINPHLTKDNIKISGAGVAYLFAKALNPKNKDMAHIALVGMSGDIIELNKEILNDAISEGKIEVNYGLKIFGAQTRPLHKILQYSTDPYIPGVTGSEEGAINFLNELGINLIENNNYKKLTNLTQEELKKLTTGIILKRLGSEKNPEDIFGEVYLLKQEDNESLTKEVREFSTLLNCCGRMDKPTLGIGTCLDNNSIKEKAFELAKAYKAELINNLNWFYNNKEKLIQDKNFVIINAENNIKDSMIGTLASIISKSNIYPDGTMILAMAYTLDDNVKISMRGCNTEIDLRKLLIQITGNLGEAGGHKYACGTLIKMEDEQRFINNSISILSKVK